MNEQEFTSRVQRALNQGTERLPYKVVHRLEKSREAAVSRVGSQQKSVVSFGSTLALSGVSSEMPLWRQALNFAVPALVIAAALFAINVSRDADEVDATAALDRAMLTDDLPISAYTDYGYGVFLKNSRQ